MSADSDSSLIKSFIVVLGGLVVFTVCIMFLAKVVAPPADYSNDSMLTESTQKRIEPVGQLRTADSVAEGSGEVAVAAAPKSAQELYDGICASCHATGVAGAPKVDDTAEWAKRGGAGVDALVATVVSGKGAMPPKGGSTYSEEEIKSVVELLLGQEAAPAAAEEEAVPVAAEEVVPAAEAEAAPTETAAVDAPAAETPAAVKTTVDTICSACHIAGVANAPKFGDKADWDARLAVAGIDGLVATSIAGKGAMPPRGSSQLTDEQLAQAVGYMLTK